MFKKSKSAASEKTIKKSEKFYFRIIQDALAILKPKKKKETFEFPTPKKSEYFGRRSEIVTAYTKRGTKQLKLKNALKGNYEFDFITK